MVNIPKLPERFTIERWPNGGYTVVEASLSPGYHATPIASFTDYSELLEWLRIAFHNSTHPFEKTS